MRTLGLPELLIILGLLVLLMGGARISRLFEWLGRRTRATANQVKWLYESLGGTDEEEIRAEREVGAELAGKFLAQMPRDPDEKVQELVGRVGGRLAQTPQAKNRSFIFQVVQGPTANAYALPGGYIFVTRGLIDLCGADPDETAFLLAHEVGHVICRHMAEQKLVNALLSALKAGQIAGEMLGKGYSREQEREADLKGAQLAAEAGFDARAALRVLRKLSDVAPDAVGLIQYFATHPNAEERLEYVLQQFKRNAPGATS